MCLAILKPFGKHVRKKDLRRGFSYNDDGAGFMYIKDGNLIIDKGYFTFRKFYKALRTAEMDCPDSHFVIHFRMATSGQIDDTNCHPFLVKDGIGFVHNGVFEKLGNKYFSDTKEFNWTILSKFPYNFMYKRDFITKLKELCGYSNKLVFLNEKNNYLIINADSGHWNDGVWFSNFSYTPSYKSTWYGTGYTTYIADEDNPATCVWRYCEICGVIEKLPDLHYVVESRCMMCENCYNEYRAVYPNPRDYIESTIRLVDTATASTNEALMKRAEYKCHFCGNAEKFRKDNTGVACEQCGHTEVSGWVESMDDIMKYFNNGRTQDGEILYDGV